MLSITQEISAMQSVDKKICLLVETLTGGGGREKICTITANYLAARGWEITLIVLNLNQASCRHDLDSRIRVVDLHKRRLKDAFYTLKNFIKQEEYTKILAFSANLGVYLLRIRFFLQHQFKIITEVDVSLKGHIKLRKSIGLSLYRYLVDYHIYLLLRRVDYIITVSQGLKEELSKYYKIKPQKLTTIYNPVGPEYKKNQKKLQKKTKLKRSKELLFVGRFAAEKRVDFLLRAFAACLIKRNDLHLRLVGKGILQNELEKLVETLAIENHVTFERFHKNVRSFYENADITVLTSSYEGFGNVLLESISVGTPVVSVDCPYGPSEIIVNGVNGYLVPMHDREGFSKKISQCLAKNFPPEQVQKTALRFDSAKLLQKYEQVIAKV